MHRVLPSIVFGLVIGLLFVAVLFATGCKNVYNTQSFEGTVCSHLLDMRGVKSGDNRDQIQNECVELTIKTEREADAKGEGDRYHEYLKCLSYAPTFTDAQSCRRLTGWDVR